jgi:two-component system, cell cycle response regulator DivK
VTFPEARRERQVLFNIPLVLIVDDDEDSCAMYAYALLAMGFQPIVADSGEEAFARACAMHPDVVVADVILPGMSGVELTRKLRHDDRTKEAAIIVMTGRTFGSEQQQAHEAGCDRFLLKPCLPDELASQIRQLLAARAQAKVAEHHSPGLV